jgi:hypothetical protein
MDARAVTHDSLTNIGASSPGLNYRTHPDRSNLTGRQSSESELSTESSLSELSTRRHSSSSSAIHPCRAESSKVADSHSRKFLTSALFASFSASVSLTTLSRAFLTHIGNFCTPC